MKTRVIQNGPEQPVTGTGYVQSTGPPRRSESLAARMGRWSAAHKKTAILGWIAFVAVAFLIGGMVGTERLDPQKSGVGEAGRADAILADDFERPQGDTILIQGSRTTVDDPGFRRAVEDVTRTVSRLEQVKEVQSPFTAGNEGQISADRHTALVTLELATIDIEEAKKLDVVVERAIVAAAARHPELAIEEFGINAEKQLDDAVVSDFKKAGVFSLPVTLIVLVVAFGAIVAAGLPVLLALSAVVATMGLLALPSHLIPLDKDVSVIVLLIGLAVGVDYALFYLKRAREERAAGRTEQAALEAAARTSGRAVLISGLTVMVAMAGMLFTGDKTFVGFGIATMIVVAVAVLGSLTVLPAALAALGGKVDKGRVPFLHRLGRPAGESRAWGWVLDRVLRRPLVSAVVAGGMLLALAAPALHLDVGTPGFETLPQNLSAVQTYNKLQEAFPGQAVSAQVVVKADDIGTPAVAEAIAKLERQAIATGQFSTPTDVDTNEQGTVAVVSLAIQGDGTDARSVDALETLRGTVIPATVGTIPNAQVAVTGPTAKDKDSNDQMKHAAPLVFAFVLAFAFLLMLVTFRSVVIAAKSIVLNLLSVSAAYGGLVLVFQHGVGKGLLGFTETGPIIGFLPIFLFVILFGLSMDYHVFILSRIREAFDGGMTTEDAVSHGIKSTAGVVTSAALVMVGVFAVFASLQFMFLKQFGVGLAIAVLIDATIVRAVLLPASMKLLGNWNWYLPKWLEWLPRIERADGTKPAPVPASASPAFAEPSSDAV